MRRRRRKAQAAPADGAEEEKEGLQPARRREGRGREHPALMRVRVGRVTRPTRAGRLHFDRRAVQHGGAGQRVDALVVDHVVDAHAGVATRRPQSRMPARSWPQPCGRHTTPGIMSAVTSAATSTCADARAQPHHRAIRRCRGAAASSGWIINVQRGLPFTRRWLLCSQELLLRTWRRPISTSDGRRLGQRRRRTAEVTQVQLGRELHAPIRRREPPQQARLERTEVDAVRRLRRSRRTLRPAGRRSGASSCRAQRAESRQRGQSASARRDTPTRRRRCAASGRACRPDPAGARSLPCAARDAARHARPRAEPQREFGEDLVVVQRVRGLREQRRRVLRDVAHREAAQARCRSGCARADSSAAG